MTAPCMDNRKCTKSFPKNCINDTITNIDGYPLYRLRDTDHDGQSHKLPMSNNTTVDIGNHWVIPYSPVVCKIYKSHINFELCSSVKSIKYLSIYVHKSSDMTVFIVQDINENENELF
uniref:Uncharacterized protein n=1 Tax=Sipha flava TaxID=143950 RepID=A0A2S2R7Q5_9HEMI